MPKKTFFAYSFLKVHLHQSSKIKCRNKSQNSRNQGFSKFFCLLYLGSRSGTGPDQYQKITDPDADPGGQKHTDPTDPDADPEHWSEILNFFFHFGLIGICLKKCAKFAPFFDEN
jgi:hypothetical protein